MRAQSRIVNPRRKGAEVAREKRMTERFTKLEGAAWGGLLGVHGRLMRLIERDFADRCGISHPEFEILLRLSWAQAHRARIQDLAAASVLTRSGTSRAVARLERLGLVGRETAPEDRRGNYAILLPAGAKRLAQALDGHVSLVRGVFLTLFTPEELESMAEYWRRVEAALAADAPEA
jgi:DNA-binding MarR family transcriptional regulator